MSNRASSGMPGFDGVIQGLRTGDNVVWQIDDLDCYRRYVDAFVAQAAKDRRRLVYLRFGRHAPLVPEAAAARVYTLDALSGFESFSRQVHSIITAEGRGVYYVFDCLSDLLSAWATDLMIGNFFMVTCPYLYELDTIAYFAVQRNSHSYKTIARIRETTQLLIDLYDCEGTCYVHPIKVWRRYSPTMFLPHVQQDETLTPLTSSVDASRIYEYICRNTPETTRRSLDYWDYLFAQAEDLLKRQRPASEQWEMIEDLCRKMMTTDRKMIALVKRFFSLEDLLAVRARIVGTGFVGGKTVGMLLARNILSRDDSFDWKRYFEPHDSFFIGSDVFYTYIVQNGWWRLWMEQKTDEGYFRTAETLREKLPTGEFPEEIRENFYQVINYFGQSPIIVRSSSLQEDAYGNAFAGKYESVFLANQGTPEERYAKFLDAVRAVYASTMGEDALVYRKKRGLDKSDEQMALLVQRVSGSYHGRYFFPFCAGVGISFNTFVWNKDIDPEAGMLRLVFGLGTRAVNRVEGDYPRIVALDAPKAQPLAERADARRFSQHEVDVIDTVENRLATVPLDAVQGETGLPLELIAVRDTTVPGEPLVLTFDRLLTETPFTPLMQRMVKTLEDTYRYPVDIEFTLNFARDGAPQVNLVQCRPIQTKGIGKQVTIPDAIDPADILFASHGNFAGGNISQPLRRVIFVDPAGYAALPIADKYQVARLIGRLNRLEPDREKKPALLLGPGRWGTTTPSLGIPVNFYEINNVAALVELEFSNGNLTPELSFGSHFFHDLVENGIFFVALFQKGEGIVFNRGWFATLANRLNELLPGQERFGGIINVYDLDTEALLMSDIVSQRVVCFKNRR